MARPNKCRICGYRFKSGEDICPECFTARDDDISCDQFSHDEHSHVQGYPTGGSQSDIYDEFGEKSFVDEQREDEASDPIPGSTYTGHGAASGPGYGGRTGYTPPSSQGYVPPTGNAQSRIDALNAIRNGTGTQQFGQGSVYQRPGNYNRGIPNYPGNRYPNGAPMPIKKKSAGAVVALFLFIIFFLPVVIFILVSTNYNRKQEEKKKESLLKDFSYVMSMEDISMPDFSKLDARKKTVTFDNYTIEARFIKSYLPFDAKDAEQYFSEDEFESFSYDLDELKNCRIMSFDIEFTPLDNSEWYIDPMNCTLEGFDKTGKSVSLSKCFDTDTETTFAKGCLFIVPTEAVTFQLKVALADSDSENILKLNDWNYEYDSSSFGLLALDAAYDPEQNISYAPSESGDSDDSESDLSQEMTNETSE
ncbi:MAG: hypothetical protein IKP47_03390 [Ruminococcus sp.]|nr:hypothetical protein [Ruminococcus sp.]